MGNHKVTAEIIEQMTVLREKAWSCKRIAKKFGVSPGTVEWHCIRLGAEAPANAARVLPQTAKIPLIVQRGTYEVRRFSIEEDAELQEMAQAGATIADMARKLNRRTNSICGRLMTLARHEARREAAAVLSAPLSISTEK